MFNKIAPPVNHNYWLKSLNTINLKQTNQNSTKVPKVFDNIIRMLKLFKDFWSRCILQSNVPSLPGFSQLRIECRMPEVFKNQTYQDNRKLLKLPSF